MFPFSSRIYLTWTFLWEISVHFVITNGYNYSFCSNGSLYTFSSDACPGGVLFKNGLYIDEPCHCAGSDLRIYSSCEERSLVKVESTAPGCSKPLIKSGDQWRGKVMAIIPAQFNLKARIPKESCPEIPGTCARSNSRIFLKRPEIMERELIGILEKLKEEPTTTIAGSSLEGKSVAKTEGSGGNSSSFSSSSGSSSDSYESSDSDEGGGEEESSTVDYTRIIEPLESPSKTDSLGRSVIEEPRNSKNQYDPLSNKIGPLQPLDSISPQNPRYVRNEPTRSEMDNIMIDNKALMRHISDVKVGHIPDPPPNTKTFKMLKQSMTIVGKIIPNKIIKPINLYEAYLAFRQLFAHIDEDERMDKHLSYEDFNSVMLSLDLCANNVRELAFKTSGRPKQIKSFYKMDDVGYTVEDINVPDDRAHKIDSEDYIVGIMWKIFDITLSTCIQELKRNPGSQFDYVTTIENLFQRQEVQKRWNQPQLPPSTESQTKIELISHPDMKIFMENLDKVDAAAHSASPFKDFLAKPKRVLMGPIVIPFEPSDSDVSPGDGQQGSVTSPPDKSPPETEKPPVTPAPSQPADTPDKPEERRRKKRETISSTKEEGKNKEIAQSSKPLVVTEKKGRKRMNFLHDLPHFEIWDGTAYCLQKRHPRQHPSYSNTLPSIKAVCHDSGR